jgi:hypothetical protein
MLTLNMTAAVLIAFLLILTGFSFALVLRPRFEVTIKIDRKLLRDAREIESDEPE